MKSLLRPNVALVGKSFPSVQKYVLSEFVFAWDGELSEEYIDEVAIEEFSVVEESQESLEFLDHMLGGALELLPIEAEEELLNWEAMEPLDCCPRQCELRFIAKRSSRYAYYFAGRSSAAPGRST
jgi:hypothetical protein